MCKYRCICFCKHNSTLLPKKNGLITSLKWKNKYHVWNSITSDKKWESPSEKQNVKFQKN